MKIISWLGVVFVALLGISPLAYGYNRFGGYWVWHHMMPWGGGFFMGLIGLVIVVAVLYFIFQASHNHSHYSITEKTTALDILKKRYARGEITKTEFEQMKRDLEE